MEIGSKFLKVMRESLCCRVLHRNYDQKNFAVCLNFHNICIHLTFQLPQKLLELPPIKFVYLLF